MINTIAYIDRFTTSFINQVIPHTPFLDTIFRFLSFQGSAIIIWIIIFCIFFIYEERKEKKFIVYFATIIIISAVLTNYVFKTAFHRQRPLPPLKTITLTCPKDFSFPSGHSAIAFASAYTLSRFDKKRRYVYYLIASLIAISRIYLYCHYFLDTLGGALLGSSVAWLFMKIHLQNKKKD